MAQVTNPLLTFRVDLPRRKHLRCVVWESIPALLANTPEVGKKDYRSTFQPLCEGACIGTMHLVATDLKNGTRAHEIDHMIEHVMEVLFGEFRAVTVETVTNDIDTALSKAGLI